MINETQSHFRKVFQTTPEMKQEFGNFLRTIFYQLDQDKVFKAMEEILQEPTKSDEQIYKELQGRIDSLKKPCSLLRKIWSLFVLKSGMGKQARELMDPFNKEKFQDYLEVYDRRYINPMRQSAGLPLKGKTVAVCDRELLTFSDKLQAGALLSDFPSYQKYVPLNDDDCQDPLKTPEKTYHPIEAKNVPDNSIDLVNCLGGFHHIPTDRVKPFADSLSRSLKPGGVLLFRDHAVEGEKSEELRSIASVVHTFVNLSDGVSWEIESKEERNFASMQQWEKTLQSSGFTRASPKALVLKDDPTANAMAVFVKTPKTLKELKQAVAYRSDSQRPKEGTRATWIEWGNVRFSKQYAEFLQNHHSYAFDYLGHLRQHWSYFYHYVRESWKDKEVSCRQLFLSDNMAMNLFILTAATVQCVAGGILNLPSMLFARWIHGPNWRNVTNLSVLEKFHAKTEQEYSTFIDHTPFYCFDYIGKIKEMWKTVWGAEQHWTTQCTDVIEAALSTLSFAAKALVSAPIRAFYTSDAHKEPDMVHILVKDPKNQVQGEHVKVVYATEDGHKLISMPRYRPFTEFCEKIAKNKDVDLIEIGGQTKISVDIILEKGKEKLQIRGAEYIYEMDKLQDDQERRYATYMVQVSQLHQFLQKVKVEYVHE